MADKNLCPLTVKIITPEGEKDEILCDSLTVNVCDNEKGTGGGSYGIRRGHAEALMALSEGRITAKKGEEILFSEILPGGFLSVKSNCIKIIL